MPSPSEEALRALADSVGHELPPTYLAFARNHDGARPEQNSVATSENEVGVSRFIPAAEAATLSQEIDGFPVEAILFAEDDCGNYFYLKPKTGAVHFWDHEVEDGDEQVADDVAAFVEKLKPFDSTSVKLAPGQVKRVWVNPSFKPEF
jgi:hypothetical protein